MDRLFCVYRSYINITCQKCDCYPMGGVGVIYSRFVLVLNKVLQVLFSVTGVKVL